jgi:hypothetical protein
VAVDLESELDRMYGVELDQFVPERTRVVRALKKDGRRAEAAQVQELRKPSLPAWTVNQLVRRNRKDVDLLLAAGERLAEAQNALLGGGDQGAFAEAREREQGRLKSLRGAAREILGQRASDETIERVASTLRAAIGTAEGRAQLDEGRLTAGIEPRGFEAFTGAPVPAATTGADAAARRSKAGERRSDAADRKKARLEAKAHARANLKAAREREAFLAKQLRKADHAVQAARKALDAAEREAERVRADRDRATEAVEVSRRELDQATEA